MTTSAERAWTEYAANPDTDNDGAPETFRAAFEMATRWRPISDAPTDGTTIFGANWQTGQRCMISFNDTAWWVVDGLTNLPMAVTFRPTHFQWLSEMPDWPKDTP